MLNGLSLTEKLAQQLQRTVSGEDRSRARLHLLDWLGCVAGAKGTAVGGTVHDAGGLGNVLEMDDVHRTALLHPGPVVWAAVASMYPQTLGEALDAGVRGYEAMIALGEALDAWHYAHFHPTASVGAFGAAAAGASLLKLNAEKTADALGNAASVAGGLWRMRHEDVLTKQFHLIHAVETGCRAAMLAREGVTGARHVLEGEQGLFAAMTREPRPERMATRDRWRIHEVSFKPYAACRHAHPAIDAALALAPSGALSAGDIRVETYADAVRFCDRAEPETEVQAKFSLQHAVALVAVRGGVGLRDFDAAARSDSALAAVRRRVQVMEALDFTDAYPGHFGARVSAGGAVVQVHDALGDPERPMGADGLAAKARELMAYGGFDREEADEVIGYVLESDPATPFQPLCRRVEAWAEM
jgi:2-methylcitrate dehydratase PrpD